MKKILTIFLCSGLLLTGCGNIDSATFGSGAAPATQTSTSGNDWGTVAKPTETPDQDVWTSTSIREFLVLAEYPEDPEIDSSLESLSELYTVPFTLRTTEQWEDIYECLEPLSVALAEQQGWRVPQGAKLDTSSLVSAVNDNTERSIQITSFRDDDNGGNFVSYSYNLDLANREVTLSKATQRNEYVPIECDLVVDWSSPYTALNSVIQEFGVDTDYSKYEEDRNGNYISWETDSEFWDVFSDIDAYPNYAEAHIDLYSTGAPMYIGYMQANQSDLRFEAQFFNLMITYDRDGESCTSCSCGCGDMGGADCETICGLGE